MRKIDLLDEVKIKRTASSQIRIHNQTRVGQAVFNAAYDLFPKAVDKIRSTEYDCFYDDERIPKFLERLRELDAE